MNLPETFAFSQHSLQDFLDCPQRFLLRYGRQLVWPAVQALPVQEHEQRMERGSRFHRLVQQHILGVPTERLTASLTDPDLSLLWNNYLTAQPAVLPGQRYPEITLAAPLAEQTLLAKLDLLVVSPEGEATIFDWKTETKLPKAAWLEDRLQTRVYRLLVSRAGARFRNGRGFKPEEITFVYWYAAFPETDFRFRYDEAQAIEDEKFLSSVIEDILQLPEEAFTRTEEMKRCQYCVYRSYCDRGLQARYLEDAPELQEIEENMDWSFDQIAEIEF